VEVGSRCRAIYAKSLTERGFQRFSGGGKWGKWGRPETPIYEKKIKIDFRGLRPTPLTLLIPRNLLHLQLVSPALPPLTPLFFLLLPAYFCAGTRSACACGRYAPKVSVIWRSVSSYNN
jgi:hypothetical protein